MRRRFWAALVLFVFLVAAAVPLLIFLSGSTDVGEYSAADLPIQVQSVSERRAGSGVAYVPGELLIKFVHGAAEDANGVLRAGQGAEELYVSPFSSVRRWRVPASRSVEDWAAFFSGHPLVEYAEPNYYFSTS